MLNLDKTNSSTDSENKENQLIANIQVNVRFKVKKKLFQAEKSFDEERDDQLVLQLEHKIASHVSSFQKFIENL